MKDSQDSFSVGAAFVLAILIIFGIVTYVNAKSNCPNGTLVRSADFSFDMYVCVEDK